MLRFENLQAPAEDGGILLEPPPREWLRLSEENARLLRLTGVVLAGVSAGDARARIRSQLSPDKDDALIVASGHQPEFVHPGVWAKHVTLRAFSESAGVAGVDLVVDHDAPRVSGLRIAFRPENGFLELQEVAFGQAPAGAAYEGRSPVDREQIKAIREQLAAMLGTRFNESFMPAYFAGIEQCVNPADVVDQHLAGRLHVDTALGAALPEHRASRVFGGPFLADLLLNADRFAHCYNESLKEYRRQQGVRSADRPLPDLGRENGRIETALWLCQPLQRRRRFWVEQQGDRLGCYADATLVGELSREALVRDPDAATGSLRPWLVRPRALTFTLWARLLACDLFVHGIGGAKYDRITDGLFRRYYRCEAPAYVCVSATLRSSWPMFPITDEDLAVARHQVRDWRFNPQRYSRKLPPLLLAEREELIGRSEYLRQSRGPRTQRREVFLAIRAVNSRLVESCPEIGQDLACRRDLLARQVASNRVAADREYFYALQPGERLSSLARRLAEAVRLPVP